MGKNPKTVCVCGEWGGGIWYLLADLGKGNVNNDSGLWDSCMFWALLALLITLMAVCVSFCPNFCDYSVMFIMTLCSDRQGIFFQEVRHCREEMSRNILHCVHFQMLYCTWEGGILKWKLDLRFFNMNSGEVFSRKNKVIRNQNTLFSSNCFLNLLHT